ncbi:GNAT family N-acetyltransferase [Arthrobacter russicus]|jgi:putative acetyltransferase|uniref:Acetyltransferase n=1 Tax=Arthrobacter russicus TaxID=172040 RepID=A0ABU1JF81_9MICC|nr:GNAT family N-acetyltransferase [Arthrobacter russicus]MDN5670342.1 GNAT family N-acetyltransferase [Renibacterium salmoninarum]MDR6271035.1 putative acetyltransferase [Arthrobacter russicus]
MRIVAESPDHPEVRALLAEHLEEMLRTSPAESVHALDLDRLKQPDVTFWTAREPGSLLGCGALKQLSATSGEIKSMRTAGGARRRGVAGAILGEIVREAGTRGYRSLFLETGSQDFFAPARRLYRAHGFTEAEPFADYSADPHSVFMALRLDSNGPVSPASTTHGRTSRNPPAGH